ncbi:MAG: hypothetical protein JWN28_973 [Candidatus Saccharibacteria bacterium]|nr:hypothetical protein [Candidatus Saccharibacteria bacterium]
MQLAKKQQGFTIVELLIVVVVIAILAAITIVSYNGIINRANASAAQNAVQQASKKINIYAVENGETYPADIASFESLGMVSGGDLTYQYTANNTSDPKGFCVTATKNRTSYYIASNYTYLDGSPITVNMASPAEGACPTHSGSGIAIINFSTNPSIETSATGFFGPNSSAYAVNGTRAYRGATSLMVTMPVSPDSLVGVRIYRASSTGVAGGLAFSKTYTVSAYVYVPTGTVDLYLNVQGTATTNDRDPAARKASLKNQWVRVYNTFDTTASSGSVDLYIVNHAATATAGTQFWVDGIMINEGSSPYAYADGSTPGWSWSGTVNESTSTGPAQ